MVLDGGGGRPNAYVSWQGGLGVDDKITVYVGMVRGLQSPNIWFVLH